VQSVRRISLNWRLVCRTCHDDDCMAMVMEGQNKQTEGAVYWCAFGHVSVYNEHTTPTELVYTFPSRDMFKRRES
jgi:hypothetical protein